MRTIVFTLLIVFLLGLPCVAAGQSPQSANGSAAGGQSGRTGMTTTIMSSGKGDGLGEYLIGPSDLLSISVLESPELTRDVRVASDGTLALPLLAEHPHVAGLSLTQAEALLKKKYQEGGILNDPNITVTLKELESKPVTVSGAVRQPGVFQVSGSVRLLQILTLAGGLGENSGTTIQVIREEDSGSRHTTEVRVADVRSGLDQANVFVRGGDIVNVPPAGAVYVLGAVNRQGRVLLPSDMDQTTVLNILAMAEGTKRTAKLSHAVLLRRKETSNEVEQIPLDLKKIIAQEQSDVAIRPNDVLYVPDSTAKHAFARGLESALQVATGVLVYTAVP
jgi:polysaccharide export outer membrane protein